MINTYPKLMDVGAKKWIVCDSLEEQVQKYGNWKVLGFEANKYGHIIVYLEEKS